MLASLVFAASARAAFVAPDPGGSEATPLTEVPEGKYMGFNDDAVGSLNGPLHGLDQADYVTLTRTIGGNLFRARIDWRHAEPQRDVWREAWWDRWRTFYEAALARGVKPLFTVGYAPSWAREPEYQDCDAFGACEFPPTRDMDAQWAEFTAEVAKRFPEAILSIWSEANHVIRWRSGADPERFAELLAIAYDAIKAESPSTMVLAGGLSANQTTGDGSIALREFLNRAYQASPSIKGHMDAISFHPYPHGSNLGANGLFAKVFDDVRSTRAKHDDSATPLFVVEVGASNVYPDNLDERTRANTLLRIYRRTMTMPDVIGVTFHRPAEPRDTTGDPWELGSAWTDYGPMPPAPRLAFCRFVNEAEGSYPGCAVESHAAPPEVAVGGLPGLLRVHAQRKRVRYRHRVRNASQTDSGRLALCLRVPRRVTVVGPSCRKVKNVRPAAQRVRVFRLRISPRARGKLTRIRFVVRGSKIAPKQSMARLRVRQ